ncbi:cadherin-like beta sandwich domain-containing protein [Clostridium sp. 'deep sea']|uniref:cadherin-like beta sandwich domain-containing protein n=1 Tax=Clostridium sp. 'deep sea' TaxID=2779445 RepID=UPI001FAC1984|nr:cadherin-like beta sandwich domain-containing protein [Clostridium sp. 'deep sea']
MGALALSPSFAGDVYAYTADTTNASNTITATPLKQGVTVVVKVNDVVHENGTAATWQEGVNTVEATVKYGTTTKIYTATVTKS